MRGLAPTALLLLAGCQEPFERRRQDLGPFRIAAVGVDDRGVASAAVYSGHGLAHAEAPTLTWSLDGESIGDGYDVVVPGPGTLSLIARSYDGFEEQASVTVAVPPAAPALEREAVALDGLGLEARRAVQGSPVDTAVPEGQATRLRLVPDDGEGLRTRWMTVEGEGTLLELDTFEADVLREEVTFDDGEVASREDLGPGRTTHLALVQDGAGSNGWWWVETVVGQDAPLWRHEGWLFEGEVDVSTGLVAVTLLNQGDRLFEVLDPAPAVSLDDGEQLDCAIPGVPFRIAWIAEGRCPTGEFHGRRVVVSAW